MREARDPGHPVGALQRAVPARAEIEPRDVLAFAGFLKGHLKGQTSLRIPAEWATQAALVQAAAQVVLPHRLIRETETTREFRRLAEPLGVDAPDRGLDAEEQGIPPDILRNADLQEAVFDAYRKDFVQFGFEPGAGVTHAALVCPPSVRMV
jgi:hypothetical protein